MVVRLVLLMLVAWCRGCHLFLENPSSTIIQYFSPLREIITSVLEHKAMFHLSSYGSAAPKPIIVWSTTKLVETLKRPPGHATERLSVRSKGGHVTGRREALKSSQAYPPAFGTTVSNIFKTSATAQSMDDLMEDDGPCHLICHVVFQQASCQEEEDLSKSTLSHLLCMGWEHRHA